MAERPTHLDGLLDQLEEQPDTDFWVHHHVGSGVTQLIYDYVSRLPVSQDRLTALVLTQKPIVDQWAQALGDWGCESVLAIPTTSSMYEALEDAEIEMASVVVLGLNVLRKDRILVEVQRKPLGLLVAAIEVRNVTPTVAEQVNELARFANRTLRLTTTSEMQDTDEDWADELTHYTVRTPIPDPSFSRIVTFPIDKAEADCFQEAARVLGQAFHQHLYPNLRMPNSRPDLHRKLSGIMAQIDFEVPAGAQIGGVNPPDPPLRASGYAADSHDQIEDLTEEFFPSARLDDDYLDDPHYLDEHFRTAMASLLRRLGDLDDDPRLRALDQLLTKSEFTNVLVTVRRAVEIHYVTSYLRANGHSMVSVTEQAGPPDSWNSGITVMTSEAAGQALYGFEMEHDWSHVSWTAANNALLFVLSSRGIPSSRLEPSPSLPTELDL